MSSPRDGRAVLTDRERQVLRLVAEGCTNEEIAGLLCISIFTVQNHVQNILRKLNARNRTQAGAIYFQRGQFWGEENS